MPNKMRVEQRSAATNRAIRVRQAVIRRPVEIRLRLRQSPQVITGEQNQRIVAFQRGLRTLPLRARRFRSGVA
jgi:hypothetical protein